MTTRPHARTSRAALSLLTAAAVLLATLGAPPAAEARQPANVLPGHQMRLQKNDHALGITGGYGGTNGFAYRKYIGNSFIQFSTLPLMADRGDFLAIMLGAYAGRYLIVWHRQRSASLVPSTTALRAVAAVSTWLSRDASGFNTADVAPCVGVNCGTGTGTGESESDITTTTTVAAGIGFEFGGVLRSGFSLSVDLMLTSAWDQDGFKMLVPLPYASIMYSW